MRNMEGSDARMGVGIQSGEGPRQELVGLD